MADNPILGDYNGIRQVASQLSDAANTFEGIGNNLKRVDLSDNWEGQAFKAFQNSYMDSAPGHWFDAADAFGQASKIMSDYARTLEAHHNAAQTCVDQIQSNSADPELWKILDGIKNQAKADAARAGEQIAQHTAGALPPRGTPSHVGRDIYEETMKGLKDIGKVGSGVPNAIGEFDSHIQNDAYKGMQKLANGVEDTETFVENKTEQGINWIKGTWKELGGD